MLVYVKGVQFGNKGASLMLAAIESRLRAFDPNIEIALAPHAQSPYPVRAARGYWQFADIRYKRWDFNHFAYFAPPPILANGRAFGIVTERDVSLILDASGYAYGDSWSPWPTVHAARQAQRCRHNGKHYIFLPQAFGPFERTQTQSAIRRAVSCADLVFARDEGSLKHLVHLFERLPDNLSLCPDITIGFHGGADAARRWNVDRQTVLLIPNSRMISAQQASSDWRQVYVPFMLAMARSTRTLGYEPVLLNHAGRGDAALCAQIAGQDGALRVIDEPDAAAIKGILAAPAAAVSSRFHGCVSTLSQAVPCLATSWSHKYQELFCDFARPDWLLHDGDVAKASSALSAILAERDRHAAHLAAQAANLRSRVDQMWHSIFTRIS